MLKLKTLPAAEREIETATLWYEEQAPGLGAALLDEIESALRNIAAAPNRRTRYRTKFRKFVLRRFP